MLKSLVQWAVCVINQVDGQRRRRPEAEGWSVAEECTWQQLLWQTEQLRGWMRRAAGESAWRELLRSIYRCVADRAKAHMRSAELRRHRWLHRLTGLAAASRYPKTAAVYAAEPVFGREERRVWRAAEEFPWPVAILRLPHWMAPAQQPLHGASTSALWAGLGKAPKQSRARSGARGVGDPSVNRSTRYLIEMRIDFDIISASRASLPRDQISAHCKHYLRSHHELQANSQFANTRMRKPSQSHGTFSFDARPRRCCSCSKPSSNVFSPARCCCFCPDASPIMIEVRATPQQIIWKKLIPAMPR